MELSARIHHHQQERKFTLPIDGTEATLEYEVSEASETQRGSAVVDFTSTYVPPELRGQGVAEALVRHGLRWAKQQDYEIKASCWYVGKFLR